MYLPTNKNRYNLAMKTYWEQATCHEEVHRKLIESDILNATIESPAPKRSLDSTFFSVKNGEVVVVRDANKVFLGMFTLSLRPTFPLEIMNLIPKELKSVLYLKRLVINPEYSILGVQSIKKVIETAKIKNASKVRCEINPHILKVSKLLKIMGFSEIPNTSQIYNNKLFLEREII